MIIYDAVVEILNELKQQYENLYELSEKKRDAIVAGDADTVSKITGKEWEGIKNASKLEDERIRLVGEICSETGKKTLTMNELIELSNDKNVKSKLETASMDLTDVLRRQSEINELNKQLLEVHFEYIDFFVDSYTRKEQTSNIYSKTGSECDIQEYTLGILDSEV